MTYLELVNNVLRRIREEEITSVSANTYSKKIGDFVNDAKRLVKTAWDWSGLKTTIVGAGGDAQVDLYPVPDDVYQLTCRCVLRNPSLVDNTDVLRIPWEPVLHFAVALAARERGETGGTSTPEYFAIADKYLSDAIALDAQKHPYATDWYTP